LRKDINLFGIKFTFFCLSVDRWQETALLIFLALAFVSEKKPNVLECALAFYTDAQHPNKYTSVLIRTISFSKCNKKNNPFNCIDNQYSMVLSI
jgi:hypothetical protein